MTYDPATGSLRWVKRPLDSFKRRRSWLSWNTRFAGKEVGSLHAGGYRYTKFDGGVHLVHRLIWMFVYGAVPEQIDHINHNRSDNRLINLRAADPHVNGANISLPSDNSSGRIGVYRGRRGKWTAKIGYRGLKLTLGTFQTFDEASEARARAEAAMGFHPNHGAPANENARRRAA